MEETSDKTKGNSTGDFDTVYSLNKLEDVRKKFDVIELSKKIKKKGDIVFLSKELKIRPRVLQEAVEEGRILSIFPNLSKSRTNPLSRLKTTRELELFSKKYDIYSIPVRKLYKLVKKWNKNIQRNPLLLLSKKEHSLIIGTILGDASIRQRDKNCCFRIGHSIKQKDYFFWKLDLLKYFKISELVERTKEINNSVLKTINFSTTTHPIFNYYRTLFYKNNKKVITNDILKELNFQSLAIWVCDDGSYSTKQGYITLCTNAYTLWEHKLMKRFLKEKFKLDPTIGFRDKKYYYLRFKQGDSKKLIKKIRSFIPSSMRYKIGERNE